MVEAQNAPSVSLNARVGAVAMLVSAPANLILHMHDQLLAPLSYLAWLGLTFGLWCFCEEMGSRRPLNRAGLVLLAAAFWADTTATFAVDPISIARAHVLYAFAALGVLVVWSVALMHRQETARAMGMIGSVLGGGALVLLIVAHILLGASTIFGFSQLFLALDQVGPNSFNALVTIDAVVCVWCLAACFLLWTGKVRG